MPLHRAQQFAQNVVLRVAVPQVLTIPFGEGDPGHLALLRGPVAHRIDEVVHAVVFAQPRPLAFVARQHAGFVVDGRRDVDAERRSDRLAENILAFERIAVEEVRDGIDRFVPVPTVESQEKSKKASSLCSTATTGGTRTTS